MSSVAGIERDFKTERLNERLPVEGNTLSHGNIEDASPCPQRCLPFPKTSHANPNRGAISVLVPITSAGTPLSPAKTRSGWPAEHSGLLTGLSDISCPSSEW